METAAVIKQRSKFAEQFAAIAEEHARSDFSREKFGLKKNLEKNGKIWIEEKFGKFLKNLD